MNLKDIRQVAFFTFCLFAAPSTHALGLISFGLKGGSTLSSEISKDSLGNTMGGYSHGVGFIVGGGVDIGIGAVGVMVDVLYAQRKVVYQVLDAETSRSLHVPVLVRLKMGVARLELGGYYASAIGEIYNNGVPSSYGAVNKSKADFGLTGGLAVAVPVGVASFVIEGRYNFGLENRNTAPTGLQNTRSSSFDLLAGFYF